MPVAAAQAGHAVRKVGGRAGIGLRAPHFERVLRERPRVPWFEVHSENFFCAGGKMPDILDRVRRDYPISLHGVGLSPGRADGLDAGHLDRLAALVRRCAPALVSEHLCWGAVGARHLNALLPLPYTDEALALLTEHVDAVQQRLGRAILIENISSYLEFRHSCMPEWEFLVALAQRAGCGILLDVNNVYVNSVNHRFDPCAYIDAIPPALVGEIHLAGFTNFEGTGGPLLIDSHSRPVSAEVWSLYRRVLDRCGTRPTLIEWDADIPALEILLAEMRRAQALLDEQAALAA